MLIRAAQMQIFESAAEENFVRRLAAHLRENYSMATVRLPDSESKVGELSDEKLNSLVKISVERARSYNLTYESSISAYSALMFEVSPNFDLHRLSQVMLTDENFEPDTRLNELLIVLSEKNWETIRADYDVNDWQTRTEKAEISEETEKADATKTTEIAAAAMSIETPARIKPPVAIDDISFDETIRDYKPSKKIDANETAPNLDLPDTILNIKFDKE